MSLESYKRCSGDEGKQFSDHPDDTNIKGHRIDLTFEYPVRQASYPVPHHPTAITVSGHGRRHRLSTVQKCQGYRPLA
ncbi:hypothetical protein RRG08_064819 [Elysia crispata]|uniref:Uncharacterized protein n=1 Tax=Elysia crispata TaxID=231223 RepID=A0AAE1DA87_9GAST|nr:hypothetical protein RRG08_064819 [Elysia crispata]